MAKTISDRRERMMINTMESLVPENHLVRKLEHFVDWSFIHGLTDHLYSDNGRSRIDPVILYKMMFINILFGYHSMRRTCEEIKVNAAYRWFLDMDFNSKVPNYSTYSQNYKRRFKENKISEKIFKHIIEVLLNEELIDLTTVFIDGTHIKAHANKNKYINQEIEQYVKYYEDELQREINEDRLKKGKKELKKKEKKEGNEEKKNIKVSKSDPESGMFHKGEKEKCFAYNSNTACDKNGYVLDFHLDSGNKHDSVMLYGVYKKLKERFEEFTKYFVMDAGYATPHICKMLLEEGKTPLLPYLRPKTKKGFFKKYEYLYDEHLNLYVCPNNKELKYQTTDKNGYRKYAANKKDCIKCPFIEKCTASRSNQKIITRHIWEEYKEEVLDHIRHSDDFKRIYPKRKETIERVFADVKTKHNMGYTRYKGKQRVIDWVYLVFGAYNIKKMVNYKAKITVR